MKKIVFVTIISFISVLTLIFLEITVRNIKPQLTFSQAYFYSINCFSPGSILPVTLRKDQKCQMRNMYGDFDTFATLNQNGYRGKEFNTTKENGTIRILVLGDSITFGQGVSDDKTYPYFLEGLLSEKEKKVEVINAAYADWFSPDSYYVYLKNIGLQLDPDIVILGLFPWNDITDLSETVWEEIDEKGLPMKISSCCRMVTNGVMHNKSLETKYRFPVLKESHLFILLMNTLVHQFKIIKDPYQMIPRGFSNNDCVMSSECINFFEPEEKKVQKVLTAMKSLTDEKNVIFIITLLPVDVQLYPGSGVKYPSVKYVDRSDPAFIHKRLEKFFQENGIAYLDLYPVFDRERSKGYPFFRNDAHYNEIGNQITAQAISTHLLENEIIRP